MKVLIACEESQEVCKAFRALGHEAYSCDTQECSGGHPEWHIKDDVLKHLDDGWDLMIAHPPCTYLSNAGARHLFKGRKLQEERYKKGIEAREFFLKLFNADIERIAIENPRPSLIFKLPKSTQIIQPFFFGEKERKTTLLWLKNLPKLKSTNDIFKEVVPNRSFIGGRWHTFTQTVNGKDRRKLRSRTFKGVAEAMSQQWGELHFLNNKANVVEEASVASEDVKSVACTGVESTTDKALGRKVALLNPALVQGSEASIRHGQRVVDQDSASVRGEHKHLPQKKSSEASQEKRTPPKGVKSHVKNHKYYNSKMVRGVRE